MAGLDDSFFNSDEEPIDPGIIAGAGTANEPALSQTKAAAVDPQMAPVEDDVEASEAEGAEGSEESEETPVTKGRLNALLAERDKRQAAEQASQAATARAEAAERQIQALQAQRTPAQQAEVPDPIIDPQGYTRYMVAQQSAQVEAYKQAQSKFSAETAHGAPVVTAAEQAINAAMRADPTLRQQVMSHPHPYEFAVAWHKRQDLQQHLGDATSIEQLVERHAASLGYVKQGGPSPQVIDPRQTTPRPSASIASVASIGRQSANLALDPFEKKLFG